MSGKSENISLNQAFVEVKGTCTVCGGIGVKMLAGNSNYYDNFRTTEVLGICNKCQNEKIDVDEFEKKIESKKEMAQYIPETSIAKRVDLLEKEVERLKEWQKKNSP